MSTASEAQDKAAQSFEEGHAQYAALPIYITAQEGYDADATVRDQHGLPDHDSAADTNDPWHPEFGDGNAPQEPEPDPDAPTLTSISPSSGAEMATTDVTLTGTGFTSPGAKPQTSEDGTTWEDAEFKATPAVTDTSGKVALDTSSAGVVKVRVNSDAGASPSKDFTVNAPAQAPTLSAISPTSADEA